MANFFERFVSTLTVKELELLTQAISDQESFDSPTYEINLCLPDIESSTVVAPFDLNKIYELYPRKLGKASGLKKLKRQVKSREKYDLCFAAVVSYANHCKRERIEMKFIKHFSTWANTWEDWVPQLNEKPLQLTPDFGSFINK